MAVRARSSEIQTLTRQIAALQRRVKQLEHAIERGPRTSECSAPKTTAAQEWEERKTMMNAWVKYDDQERLAYYRENPRMLDAVLESERKRNAFFRERGITPPKSSLEEVARLIQETNAGEPSPSE